MTDDEWALVEPLLPPAGSGGRPEKRPRRDIVDAVLYVVRTGCLWAATARRASRPGRPPTGTSCGGRSSGSHCGCWTRCGSRSARSRAATPRPARASWTPRASRLPTSSAGTREATTGEEGAWP
ncbi:transposase [Actinomadura welshii]